MSVRYARAVEIIDRTRPENAPLFDQLRDVLTGENGVTKARYFHLVPTADGARIEVSASPPIRALAEDYVRNRRHEIDFTLLPKTRRAQPTRWVDQPRDEDCPRSVLSRRQAWRAVARTIIGDNWQHGFDVPVYGPGGRRGLFKINAPREQPLTDGYMRGVRHVAQDFHLAYCQVQLAAAERICLVPEDQEALARVAEGLKTKTIGYESGVSVRTIEDRLSRARKALDCETTPEATAKAAALGLIL